MLRSALLALALLATGTAGATRNDVASVSGMQRHHRVLVVFTPTLSDTRLTRQRAILARIALDAAKRDLVLVQVDPQRVIGARDNGDSLRRHFHVPALAYHAILIDKDGHVLGESAGPIDGATIIHAIDSAPVRRIELQRARTGKRIVDKP